MKLENGGTKSQAKSLAVDYLQFIEMMPENESTDPNKQCFTSFKMHWAEAQIDGPMQEAVRYDDVAKMLITIGGFLLTAFVAGYSIMLKDLHVVIDFRTKVLSAATFIAMLGFLIFAAIVCYPQPETRAGEILCAESDEDLKRSMTDWCDDINKVIRKKRWRLHSATAFFILSFLLMGILLLMLLNLK